MKPLPDYQHIRGFNHEPSLASTYNPEQTRRELDYAVRLTLNSCRLFLSIDEWWQDRASYEAHVRDFMDAAHERAISVTPILLLAYSVPDGPAGEGLGVAEPQLPNCYLPANYDRGEEFITAIVRGFKDHPALLLWDVQNEPSWHPSIVYIEDEEERERRLQLVWKFTRHFVRFVRSLDPVNAIGVGHTYVEDNEASGTLDDVDVILFHDYSKTRARARRVVRTALELSARYGKPTINNETGVLSRGGTYDLALHTAQEANIGWYLFKLMIEDGMWATNHGVVYADGTVRDPAIVAAILGFFRNRDPQTAVRPDVDLEHNAEAAVREAQRALADRVDAEALLEAAEFVANMLEGGELVPLWWGPVARIQAYRARDDVNLSELRAFLFDLSEQLRVACQLA